MADGTVVLISIARAGGDATASTDQVRAVAGRGLEGDRYFNNAGTFSNSPGAGRAVTLIESEAIDAVARDCGCELDYKDTRRNIVTRGVALNDLIDREFRVGGVRLRGVRLCEPCKVSFPDANVKEALVSRGGLRADILTDGEIRVGDSIEI
ncbi:MAG: MOSC domain-containing protein [Chloroflexi bacterium]|nr:MOSC domain-containing protein [Chloroflexota bacterium]MCH8010047.1 MOSC domain-containing protein [Chloroflexota bacterium]